MTAPFAADARTPAELLHAYLRAGAPDADPSRPLVTFYDDATGERVELSAKTFDNWVAKTANLLQDELNAGPETRAALLLPAHWQSAVWLLACWSVGVTAVPGGDPADADIVISGPDGLDTAKDCSGERVALALRPLGGRFPERPDGFLDYAAEVPGQGDRFAPYSPVDPQAPALETLVDGLPLKLTGEQTVALAREGALRLGLEPGSRVLSTFGYDDWTGLEAGLLAPLAAGASVVLCRNSGELTEEQWTKRIESERVTLRLG
ncbi:MULTISPECIES: TIGR03089 family protein [unclassified Kitasatospora]|uniref:TIGR03089 family protein n=1 Tax=unclassified Kitasatospora TaxID=2633591 RepID=UPI00070DEFE7|nr:MULTISPECIES: TIGR03089 family protein [unclassified Kitasatospora]KQV17567.1 acyl-CoA synthetase [Kitasatospora sp. Root107]KRB74274.1 acyl-CoA synthetase [Kitasatospora sp. Root187]